MKKIFILGLLIAPIVAHAVGPAAVGQGQTAVVATASAPYATATAETGDSTTVVSASYVKGAYNDAIAAVNKLNEKKQNKLEAEVTDPNLPITFLSPVNDIVLGSIDEATDRDLVSGKAVKNAVDSVNTTISNKRISAVTTWGDDSHPTQLQLTTASN